ncbi:MAG TPA: DUF4382 domain-containing protein [Gallionellaceae bacterium]|nr:DUF4382 domain-containing protein [Gallionellaceae bacterium]
MAISFFLKHTASLMACAVLLAGCGSGNSVNTGTGSLTLRITDAAVDSARQVYIQFHGLEIQHANGMLTTLYYCQDAADASKTVVSSAACSTAAAPKKINLLALGGGQTDVLLNGYVLPAGHYNWIRLMVDTAGMHDSYIVVADGADYELTIPSGDESGLKLNRSIDIPVGGSADFTIDFDLRKSVHATGSGQYLLRPTLRLADNSLAGTVAGTVNPLQVPAGCTPAVYVFTGAGITPDDIDGITPDPVTTASVQIDSVSGEYRYNAAFLEAGDYTIAHTCQAAVDDPAVDDALVFTSTATVAVNANTITVHNF